MRLFILSAGLFLSVGMTSAQTVGTAVSSKAPQATEKPDPLVCDKAKAECPFAAEAPEEPVAEVEVKAVEAAPVEAVAVEAIPIEAVEVEEVEIPVDPNSKK